MCLFFPFSFFAIVSRTLHPRAVSSRSTNPVLFARAILGSLILPGECQAGAASIADPVAGSRRDRKHIRSTAFARDFSPVFAILCGCLIRVSAHTRSSFVCQKCSCMTRIQDRKFYIESFFFQRYFYQLQKL